MFMRRIAVVVALGALLSGCFASEKPMFSAETAVLALGEGGRYATFELMSDGKEEPGEPFVVRPGPGNVYEFVNEKGVATPVTFHQLSGDEHVAQVKLEGNAGYGYMLARTDGRQLVAVPVECNKQDEATMKGLGVERRDQFECRIDKVADPVAFFAAVTRSKPASRMVRE
jgi:hypothetical protein